MNRAAYLPPHTTRDFFLDVAAGYKFGFTHIDFRGMFQPFNNGVTPTVIWANGGAYPWLAAPSALEIVSTSANDSASGTGARTISVTTLNADFRALTHTITLNGTTPVPVPGESPVGPLNVWKRVNNDFHVVTAGSSERNEGAITCRVAGAGAAQRVIPVLSGRGLGDSFDGVYTVPAGHRLIIRSTSMELLNPVGSVTFAVEARDNATPNAPFRNIRLRAAGDVGGGHSIVSEVLHMVPEKHDVQCVALSSTSPTNVVVKVWLDIVLIDPHVVPAS